jgi:hypothetical protein
MEWAAAAALFYGNDSKIYFAHKKLRKYLRISKKSSTFVPDYVKTHTLN